MGNRVLLLPGCGAITCSEWGALKPSCSSSCSPDALACNQCREEPGSRFFGDDAVLLDRLEAAVHGDRLLTKLHVNVALFSTTSADIIEGLLRLTRHKQGLCDVGRLNQALHGELSTRARPPVDLMKSLQWVYRFEELPAPAAQLAQRSVYAFFATMFAAAAALKWQGRPPNAWRQRGVEPQDVLMGAKMRLSEVIAGLRFLACLALLQHCADPAVLSSRRAMQAMMQACGLNADDSFGVFSSSVGDGCRVGKANSSIATGAGAEAFAEVGRRSWSSCESPKAGDTWDEFFLHAQRRPAESVSMLLKDLQGRTAAAPAGGGNAADRSAEAFSPMVSSNEACCRKHVDPSGGYVETNLGPGLPFAARPSGETPRSRGASISGRACSFAFPVVPAAVRDTWDDELIACPSALEEPVDWSDWQDRRQAAPPCPHAASGDDAQNHNQ